MLWGFSIGMGVRSCGGCIDTGGSAVMHVCLMYVLIEFFVL